MAEPPPPSPAPPLQGTRVPFASDMPVEQAVLWLREDERPFALVGDWLDGLTVLGSAPVRTARATDNPLELLDDQPGVDPGDARVGGGWVGWLGYGLGARIEELPPPPPAPVPRAPFSLAFYDHLIVYDGEQWWFESIRGPDRTGALDRRLALWASRLQTTPAPPAPGRLGPLRLAGNGAAGHLAAVADCRRRIAAGELYQANLCLRLESEYDGDCVDLFARALPSAQPRFGALVDGAVSLSPERFLRRSGRAVWTEPIKGTRPRTPAGTDQERDELLTSAKDAAEHVMIVDLMRNDLGRVCVYGTVEAHPLRAEAHSGVWHLVSRVEGRLRDRVTDGALLQATFPPGSVTGAPKVQAMKVITTLEATRRELYTGAIGLASPIAGLDLSVAIRTFELQAGRIWFGAGGGIVADSDPQLELDEALTKAGGPLAAIGAELQPVAPGQARDPIIGLPRALIRGRRPDPGQGIFETVLVEAGRLQRLEAHLQRLRTSLAELYGSELDPATAHQAAQAAAAAPASRHRLRILADPDGATTVTVARAPHRRQAPARLQPYLLPGGLGAHKWRDRRLIDRLAHAQVTPLLLDTDGEVLEAAYANVWIVEGGRHITPPADSRILAGITREAHLRAHAGNASEAPLDLERLRAADGIFLTSSISLEHPAILLG